MYWADQVESGLEADLPLHRIASTVIERRVFLAATAAAVSTGCLGEELGGPEVDVEGRVGSWNHPSPEFDVDLEPAGRVDGFDAPTDVAFVDEGYYVAERPGSLAYVEDGEVVERQEVSGVDERGDSGLLAVESVDDSLYLYHTTQLDNRLVKYDPDSGESEPLFRGVPAGAENNGGGLAQGSGRELWLATGDGRDPQSANERASPGGAVLRFDLDSPGAPEIYAKGLRDPAGLALLPDDTPVVTDRGGDADELQVVYRDADYGWPATRDPEEYVEFGYTLPLVHDDDAPGFSGCCWYDGDEHPALADRLLVASLDGEALYAVSVTPAGELPSDVAGEAYRGGASDPNLDAVVEPVLEEELGRLRSVLETPDGGLIVLTANHGYAGEGQPFVPPEGGDSVVRLG